MLPQDLLHSPLSGSARLRHNDTSASLLKGGSRDDPGAEQKHAKKK
jgi:hypothetical protein